ncbi:Aminopeptidase N [Thelohanellus kitauei]|uniref:Aminopeptidase N n=1 Tax=Thelohanellus kitauei TaxID=669202 RepID=A0A0C2ISM3_THEKT|nr:Aminopeptidase N [Thelohanellus kitauei]
MDKLSIISDMMTTIRIGKLNISTAFSHFEYLKKETDQFVMSEFFSHLKYIRRITIDIEEIRTKFENYSIGFSRPIIQRLGYDLHADRSKRLAYFSCRLLQTLAISTNIVFEDKETLNRARLEFKNYINEKAPIDPDILTTYACGYIKLSTDEEWEQLLQVFIETRDPIKKEIYRYALSCSKNVLMLERLLNMTLDPRILQLQDSGDVILDVIRSPLGPNLTWKFIKQNWKTIQSQCRFY